MSIRNKYLILISVLCVIGISYFSLSQLMQRELRERNSKVASVINFHDQLQNLEQTLYKIGIDAPLQDKHRLQLAHQVQQLDQYYNSKYLESLYVLNDKAPEMGAEIQEKYAYLRQEIDQFTNFHNKARIMELIQETENLIQKNNDFKVLTINHVRLQSKNIQSLHYVFLPLSILCMMILLLTLDKNVIKPLNAMSDKIKSEVDQFRMDEIWFDTEKQDEIGTLKEHFNQLNNRMSLINQLTLRINRQDTFEEVLDFIFDNFHWHIPYDRIGVATVDKESNSITALEAKSKKPILLGADYGEKLTQGSLWHVIEARQPRIINDFDEYLKLRPKSKSTRTLVNEGMQSSVTLPLILRDECVGVIFFSSTNKNMYSQEHIAFLKTITDALTIAFERATIRKDLLLSVIKGFAQIVESKDEVTGNHIDRIRVYTEFIAEKLMEDGKFKDVLNHRFIKKVGTYSTLHDIGKVGISDEILNKNGKLTFEEYEAMKEHSTYGARILKDMAQEIRGGNRDYFSIAYEIARHHHEKYDGTGYPDQLAGEAIPLAARIVAVADVFDALTSERPYKHALSFEESVDILLEGQGKHFDPSIIATLMSHKEALKNLFYGLKEVEVNNSELLYKNAAI